jgi:hypothetical protein
MYGVLSMPGYSLLRITTRDIVGRFLVSWGWSSAGIYRREQWQVPLAAALLEVVECSQLLDLKQVNLWLSPVNFLEGQPPLTPATANPSHYTPF